MGFWDSAGNIAGKMASGAIDSIQKQQNEINKYRQRYEEYEDNDKLYKEMLRSSGNKKLAIAMILRDRGYRVPK